MVLFYGMVSWQYTPNEPSLPAGWTKKASTPNSENRLRIGWYFKRYQAGDTAPTLSYSGTTSDIRVAKIFAFRGVLATGDPTDVLGPITSQTTWQKDMGPFTGLTTTTDGGVVLVAGVRQSDWAPNGLSTLTGDGLTWAEICDVTDYALNPGDNIGVGVDYALTPTATTVTPKTFIVDSGNTNPAMGQMWSLQAEPVAAVDESTKGAFFAFF